ncbi:hypothetical protein HGRIS_014365 [Hohenbuehelia grisea]|uniref:Helicase C-terminal domain-containing protein n=1 Tax=Hohenbuehelia grisea TaxID=104357 RepID=A0ABR3JV52_9AGAR
MPFYSLLSTQYRQTYIKAYREGTTRILIGTDTLTCGIDVSDIENGILMDLSATPERQTQQIGRVGRNGKPESADRERRLKMNPRQYHWFNSTQEHCSRSVSCEYYGDPFLAVDHCCIDCEPEDEDEKQVQRWIEILDQGLRRNMGPRTDGTHHALDKYLMEPAALRIIDRWSRRCWKDLRQGETLPYVVFFPTHLRERLCAKLHVVTTQQKLDELLDGWEYLTQYGPSLLELCKQLLLEFDGIWKERKDIVARANNEDDPAIPTTNVHTLKRQHEAAADANNNDASTSIQLESEQVTSPVFANPVSPADNSEAARPAKRVRLVVTSKFDGYSDDEQDSDGE